MAKKFIFWKAFCNESKFVALDKINQIIDIYGDVVDVKQFSDVSMSLRIELPENTIDTLYLDLKTYIELEAFEKLESKSTRERTVFLNISFALGEGNAKVAVHYV